MNVEEIIKAKEKIEQIKMEKASLDGEMKSLYEQLKKEGFSDIAEVEEAHKKLEFEIENLERDLSKRLIKIKETGLL